MKIMTHLSCFGCRWLIQGGDGDIGCVKFPSPDNEFDAHGLANPPEPLYSDCYEEIDDKRGL